MNLTCRRLLLIGLGLAAAGRGRLPGESDIPNIDAAPHFYQQRTPADRFTRLKASLESGALELDRRSESAFVTGLLQALDIPVSSQMLVFSTTSLQLSLISPANPRALYFNEDTYLGYVPGGRIEIVSLDPELGGIYYIFDIPRESRPLRIERSGRCMNCHAGEDTGHVPGLVIKSVIPGPSGGSLTAYRIGQTGHSIPFADRFGGWHVTGRHSITQHWGNLTGRLSGGQLLTITNSPGARFRFDKYPAASSDILPLLLHEHQAGFVNRAVEAAYRVRSALHESSGSQSDALTGELDAQARALTRYLLFAEEVPLPSGGVTGDPAYTAAFLKTRRISEQGLSLKDLDLRTRLFRHRCSYMIYSPSFSGLPAPLKEKVYRRLGEALRPKSSDSEFAYLPVSEKQAIRSILKDTLPDLPKGW